MEKIKNLTNSYFILTIFFIWGAVLTVVYSIVAFDSFYEEPREVQVLTHSLLIIVVAICFTSFSLHKKICSLLATLSSFMLLGISGLYNWGDTSFIAISSSFFTIMLLQPSIGLLYFAYWHDPSKNSKTAEQDNRKYMLFVLLLVAWLFFITVFFGWSVGIRLNLG